MHTLFTTFRSLLWIFLNPNQSLLSPSLHSKRKQRNKVIKQKYKLKKKQQKGKKKPTEIRFNFKPKCRKSLEMENTQIINTYNQTKRLLFKMDKSALIYKPQCNIHFQYCTTKTVTLSSLPLRNHRHHIIQDPNCETSLLLVVVQGKGSCSVFGNQSGHG